jgi:hypothetical protein
VNDWNNQMFGFDKDLDHIPDSREYDPSKLEPRGDSGTEKYYSNKVRLSVLQGRDSRFWGYNTPDYSGLGTTRFDDCEDYTLWKQKWPDPQTDDYQAKDWANPGSQYNVKH